MANRRRSVGSFVCGDNTAWDWADCEIKCNSPPNYHLFESYEKYVLTGWCSAYWLQAGNQEECKSFDPVRRGAARKAGCSQNGISFPEAGEDESHGTCSKYKTVPGKARQALRHSWVSFVWRKLHRLSWRKPHRFSFVTRRVLDSEVSAQIRQKWDNLFCLDFLVCLCQEVGSSSLILLALFSADGI